MALAFFPYILDWVAVVVVVVVVVVVLGGGGGSSKALFYISYVKPKKNLFFSWIV